MQNILTNNNLENLLFYYNIRFGISIECILKGSVFNCSILLAKYYIFLSKYKQEIPNIHGFQLLMEKTNLKISISSMLCPRFGQSLAIWKIALSDP